MTSNELTVDRSLPPELIDNPPTLTTTTTTTSPRWGDDAYTTTHSTPPPHPEPHLLSTSTPSPTTHPHDPTPTTIPANPVRTLVGRDSEGGGRGRRRKPLHPQKSLSPLDPNFRGVTLCFQVAVQGARSQLLITPFYSKNLARFQRRCRRLGFNSESDPDPGTHSPRGESAAMVAGEHYQYHHHPTPSSFLLHPRGRSPVVASGAPKSCASCSTRRTPLWRDAEDGTPLCNACGIRYRKYRLRCGSCWHIPRKDNKVFPACSQCGGLLRFSQARKC